MKLSRLTLVALLTLTLSGIPLVLMAQEEGVTPDITVRQEDDRTIREYRVNGQLYAIEIEPSSGPSYFLVDDNGDGDFTRSDAQRVTPPSWVLISW